MKISRSFKTVNGYETDEKGYKLGIWISWQRVKYKNGTLSEDRIKKLKEIDMIFGIGRQDAWNMMYELTKKYYEHYGNLKIPHSFKTINGYETDEKGYKLGIWINTQRTNYNKSILSEDKIKKLEEIGMIFENAYEAFWNKMYELAKKYYEHYGDLKIPNKFKTLNGYEVDEKGYNLGFWISNQRVKYKNGTLSEDRIKKLKEIGMIFGIGKQDAWNKMYELAKKYYEHYGDLKVSQKFKTINGYETNEKGYNLGLWITTQKTNYNKSILSEDRIEKLEEIGMIFEKVNDNTWNMMYELAKKYYEHYGNLKVPQKFKTINGYEVDEKGYNLGAWISTQRTSYNKSTLSEDKIKKLEEIGMIFENAYEDAWNKMYELAKKYYEHYGDLKIPNRFKTVNGYETNGNGYNLGGWISWQRVKYKKGSLSEDKIKKLEEIGMMWNIRKDTDTKKVLCDKHGIDSSLVENISYMELFAKINYLLDNNMDIIIDGKLNPIFFMSNENMMMNYGVSLKDMVNIYTKNKKAK